MAIKEVVLERIPSQDSVLYINKSGISFSASFIKKEKLEAAEGVKFFVDDEDPYYLGFVFTSDSSAPNTLSLMASGRSKGGSAGVTIKAAELINRNIVLKSIQKMPNKLDRTFEITFDKQQKIYSILLRPNFEVTVNWSDKNRIPDSFSGIYRYLDNNGQTVYIGKGNIKARALSPERTQWGVTRIQYSVIESDDKSYYWENYYLERFVSMNGAKPPFNVIMGKSE
jgi:hypothetical protein